jgi:hypothetical protein
VQKELLNGLEVVLVGEPGKDEEPVIVPELSLLPGEHARPFQRSFGWRQRQKAMRITALASIER